MAPGPKPTSSNERKEKPMHVPKRKEWDWMAACSTCGDCIFHKDLSSIYYSSEPQERNCGIFCSERCAQGNARAAKVGGLDIKVLRSVDLSCVHCGEDATHETAGAHQCRNLA